MLRRMCKECAKSDGEIYEKRQLTGQISRRIVIGRNTKTILKCRQCGNEWSYWRKIRK